MDTHQHETRHADRRGGQHKGGKMSEQSILESTKRLSESRSAKEAA